MIRFEIAGADDKAVLQNRFQVWVVENEGNADFPLNFHARATISKFLRKEARDCVIWGG